LGTLQPNAKYIDWRGSGKAAAQAVGHHLTRGIPVDHLPPLMVKGAHLRDKWLAKLDDFCTYSIRAKFSRRMTI
jgi:hypothetical protein